MSKAFLLSGCLFFAAIGVKAQDVTPLKKDSTAAVAAPVKSKTDTLKPKYINPGKIAGRQAMLRSAMLPGLGQIRSGLNLYRGLKVAGIYTGATLLTLSYIDNNNSYHIFLTELQTRAKITAYNQAVAANGGTPPPGLVKPDVTPDPNYASVSDANLVTAKDTYRRNKDVILFSFVGLYLLNIVDAYVDARLKYFDVGDVSVKLAPTMMNNSTMYGSNSINGLNLPVPGIKLAVRF